MTNQWYYMTGRHPRREYNGRKALFSAHLYGDKEELKQHVEKLGYTSVNAVPWMYDGESEGFY